MKSPDPKVEARREVSRFQAFRTTSSRMVVYIRREDEGARAPKSRVSQPV